jgi:hypothetical protein
MAEVVPDLSWRPDEPGRFYILVGSDAAHLKSATVNITS